MTLYPEWHDGRLYGLDRHYALLGEAAHWRQGRRAPRSTARLRVAAALIALGRRLAPAVPPTLSHDLGDTGVHFPLAGKGHG